MAHTDYFNIIGREAKDAAYIYKVLLNPDAEVYKGHFPGNPVSPGVCNMQMIARCSSDAIGSDLRITVVSRCRFLSVVSPAEQSELQVELTAEESVSGSYRISARIMDNSKVYVDFKGELVKFG